MKAMKDQKFLEYIDTMISSLRSDLTAQMSEDAQKKQYKIDEVSRLV
jgi:hypothetical protein